MSRPCPEPAVPAGAAAATRRLEVLVVAPHSVLGGQEAWLLQLLAATDRLAPRVLLLQDGPLRAELETRQVPVDVLPVGTRPYDLPLPVARLAARLRRARPDVVLANGVKAQFVAGPAARLAGVPLVFVRHDHSFEGLVARLARLADRVVGTTEEVLAAVERPDAVVVRPPLPPVRPLSAEVARGRLGALGVRRGDGPVLGMCTRLVAYKGVDDAVRALALPGGAGWRLAVLGGEDPAEPGEAARLHALATGLGVADRVDMPGYVPDAAALVAGFDALAVLTKAGGPRDPGREGFGMAALEAMSAGVPVVAVGGGAIERRLAGRAGVVVPMADPPAVAAALQVLADPLERARQGSSGRAMARDHPDAAASAARLVGVLADAARRPGAGLAPVEPVSVVVPVYDEEVGIEEVVLAVAAQLRSGDELLVVDDASRDGTADRLRRLAERVPQLTVLALGDNAGAAAARNHGVAAARHEHVVCTDAGVRVPVGWLDAMRTALADEPPVDLVTGGYDVSRRTVTEQAMGAALFPDLDDARHPGPLVRLHARLFGRSFDADRPAGRSMAFRRAAWSRVGGFPEALRAGEDVAFGLAVERQGRCVLQLDAPVTWEQHASLRATARMYSTYGRGDGLAGERVVVARNTARGAAALVTPVVLLAGGSRARSALAVAGVAYVSLPLLHLRGRPRKCASAAMVPVVLAVKDLSKAAGCWRGVRERRASAQQIPR